MDIAVMLLLVAGFALAWRLAAFVLVALAWLALVPVALSVAAGAPVPPLWIAFTVGLWFASQVATRARHGYWRSMLLRGGR